MCRAFVGPLGVALALSLVGCSAQDMEKFTASTSTSSTNTDEASAPKRFHKFAIKDMPKVLNTRLARRQKQSLNNKKNAYYKKKPLRNYAEILTGCDFEFEGLRGWKRNDQQYWRQYISPYITDRAHFFMHEGYFKSEDIKGKEANGNTASVASCGFKWDAHLDFQADAVAKKVRTHTVDGTSDIPFYKEGYNNETAGRQNFNIPPMIVEWCNFRLPVDPEHLGRHRRPTVKVKGKCDVNEKFAVDWLERRRKSAKRKVKSAQASL